MNTAAEEHWRIAESGQSRTRAHTGCKNRCEVRSWCHMNDSLRVEAEAAPVLDVAALLGGDSPALLLHYHITLLK